MELFNSLKLANMAQIQPKLTHNWNTRPKCIFWNELSGLDLEPGLLKIFMINSTLPSVKMTFCKFEMFPLKIFWDENEAQWKFHSNEMKQKNIGMTVVILDL